MGIYKQKMSPILLNRNDALEIYKDRDSLRAVDYQKLFGVVIYKHLTFDNQMDSVCLNMTHFTIMNVCIILSKMHNNMTIPFFT